MRSLALVVVCVGCGRIGFDPASARATDAASGDTGDTGADGANAAPKTYTMSGNGTQPTRLFTVDLSTGALVELGSIPGIYGTLTGLAYWGANTMYASSATNHIEITLSPFGAASTPSPVGDFAALERNGNTLIAIREGDNHISSWAPGAIVAAVPVSTLPATGQGGDLTQTSDGTWWWFTNSSKQLYKVDVSAGTAIAVGTPAVGAPFMTGLVADDADQLYAIGQSIYPISKTTGQLGATITPCSPCPSAVVSLQSGDTTRSW